MRILFVSLFLLIGSLPAQACGNPLLWAMLFKKVPEAKMVFEAELAARADGLITARVYDAKPGQPYHQWSRAWLLDLGAEMQTTVTGMLAPGEDLTILLADEVAALRFSHEAGVEFVPAAGLRAIERYDLITSINALKSVWRDGLSYSEMLEQDLAWSADGGEEVTLAGVFAAN
ncbi:hypothetical protein [Roseibium sp.]|uniref:hypothetical protein n=1 Tax=Roseibium sp. TaxID=1936156 RepID=UPI003BAEF78F